ncbi:hypothetical protein LTR70_007807 [Exophiala xenobiotica]|uniref:Uncharacterized protein n=1 Tax=Lithohypha guttulata TaxID=1690604 RepID=A0ABR0K347_9EURO|nr:hypothetical protein LTR24_007418 [Lithohypha guttulata]KAK5313052.1 hypothetical protein LTR70_007807 [Exophiala xenobiotica]
MLDESLPTFLLKSSKDKPKQNSIFLYSQYGSDFEPAYALKHLDPEQPASRNRYAVAIYDAHNPDVLFAEVLLIPDWTQPTLSQDEIRRNGGITPAPEPILPTEFAIQLYNPDQQIVVKHKPASFASAATWEFEMPTQSFRTPSHSHLDRSQSDPTISEFTPKLALKWKKDGRLSKDLGCYLSGRALNPDGSKNKHKEPDITIAILKSLKEVTIYEPNMARVEVEDLKGFEVALLLGAVVIRDVYFGSMKETFNIAGGRKTSTSSPTNATPLVATSAPHPIRRTTDPLIPEPRIPPTDPRSQWEIDQETERLRRQTALEERQRKQKEEVEQRQIKQMLEAEEKERRRRQAEVDAETERLRRVYGPQSSGLGGSAYAQQAGYSERYMTGGAPSQSAFLQPNQQKLKQKSSIFGFRRHSDH